MFGEFAASGWERASSMANSFDTFPFPTNLEPIQSIGRKYDSCRQDCMLRQGQGLTKIYGRLSNRGDQASDIADLRELHVELDRAVATAYGWSDLDLGHGIHQTKQGVRFTISEAARREILDRLLELNHQRHAEEIARGLHEKKPKSGRERPKTIRAPAQGILPFTIEIDDGKE